MILKPSPIRKSPAPLRAALRALVVSACALTPPAALAQTSATRRPVIHPSVSTSRPYLALLVPTPMRFAAPERPPAVLKIEPLPEEAESENQDSQAAAGEVSDLPTGLFGNFGDFNFALPLTTDSDPDPTESAADPEASDTATPAETTPTGPRPIILDRDSMMDARPEDIMPFFRLPSVPSSATYHKQ